MKPRGWALVLFHVATLAVIIVLFSHGRPVSFTGSCKEAPRLQPRPRTNPSCWPCHEMELKVVAGNETKVLLHDLPDVIAESDVPGFLAQYGYKAKSASEWFQWKDLPALTLHVCGHTKVDGHMFYDVKCALAEPGNWHSPYLSWRSLRRLCHLREGLHDPVKRSLGTAYREVFGNASFASSLHLPGTSARLNSWFQKLSGCLNRKEMSPALTAAALQLLGAPDAAEAAETWLQQRRPRLRMQANTYRNLLKALMVAQKLRPRAPLRHPMLPAWTTWMSPKTASIRSARILSRKLQMLMRTGP
eukprot:g6298.t1